MRLLLLGLSNLVRRRVLPALQDIDGLEQIDIATRSGAAGWQRPDWLAGATYDDYDVALQRARAEVVYVSLVNSEHERWAQAALDRGLHVVVDKPAFLGLDAAERMLELAEKRDLCMAEATVWAYHPQVDLMKGLFRASDHGPLRISATFSVPPLDAGNFRYCGSLGGGSVWDQGPYAVSVGRVFFSEAPETVEGRVLSFGGSDNVDTSFSMLATYPHGGSVVGHFGFDTAYRNHVDILSTDLALEADRVFTIPVDAQNEIRVTRNDTSELKTTPAANSFRVFLERVFQAVESRDWQGFQNDLLADARALQRLRDAAGLV